MVDYSIADMGTFETLPYGFQNYLVDISFPNPLQPS